jgi:hypothetical protein
MDVRNCNAGKLTAVGTTHLAEAPLRSDPRYQALLRRMNFPP